MLLAINVVLMSSLNFMKRTQLPIHPLGDIYGIKQSRRIASLMTEFTAMYPYLSFAEAYSEFSITKS